MANSDEIFVQEDALKYETAFSWTLENLRTRNIYTFKELKLGSCEVKWKLFIEYIDINNYYHTLKLGFHGENLGLHTGSLNFKVKHQDYGCIVLHESIQLTEKDTEMKYERYKVTNFFINGNVFKGTISVSNCDCIEKSNKKRLLKENVIQLHSDIYTPWKDKQFTDIDIKVDKTCFPAHKFILRSRSPVFAKMLEHDMKENQDNCIIVSDTDEMTMKNFLSFLYSGRLEDESFNNVMGLYSLADKYQVTILKQTCRNLLISKLSESTVLEILKTSELHTDEELKQKTTQFICDRFPKIEVSPEWSSLIDNNTRLASYVLRFVSTKFSSNY